MRNQSQTPEIEAVILDYGEVLCHRPSPDEVGQLATLFGLSLESFLELWDRSRPVYDRGSLTPEQYWLQFASEARASINRAQIEQLRRSEVAMWSNVNPVMVGWSRQLIDAGVKTALLSNMHADLVRHVRNRTGSSLTRTRKNQAAGCHSTTWLHPRERRADIRLGAKIYR